MSGLDEDLDFLEEDNSILDPDVEFLEDLAVNEDKLTEDEKEYERAFDYSTRD